MNSQNISEYSVDRDEQFVTKFLQSNPNFFGSNEELLTQIRVPHRTGAVSLIEKQLGIYRDKCKTLENQLNEVLVLASEKERQNQKLFTLSNEITRCTNLKCFERSLQNRLSADFNTDKIAFHFLNEKHVSSITRNCYSRTELQIVLNKMQNKLVICPQLSNEQKEGLYGELSDGIQSSALIALGENKNYGLLVLGSNDMNVFAPDKGTNTLETLRLLLSAKISHLLN